jgi:hypothetical protein
MINVLIINFITVIELQEVLWTHSIVTKLQLTAEINILNKITLQVFATCLSHVSMDVTCFLPHLGKNEKCVKYYTKKCTLHVVPL